MTEKIQKALARAGLGSRRAIEALIRAGRVEVNSEPAAIGVRIGEGDAVRVDGRRVRIPAFHRVLRVLLYHKPAGEICTRADPEGRPTVFEALPKLRDQRWVAVGRLDVATSGLLLFTNDGELANRLMHPSGNVEREYAVRVHGDVSDGILERLRSGVALDDGTAAFRFIERRGGDGANQWFHVVIGEGRNREVRRLWESQGLEVSRLIRVRYGPVTLPRGLRAGRFTDLDESTIGALCEAAGYHPPAPPKRPQRTPRRGRKAGTRKHARPKRYVSDK